MASEMNIKAGDIVRIKTFQEMIDCLGHAEFNKPEFFETHGNETCNVVRISKLSSGPENPIIIIDMNGYDIGIVSHAVEKCIISIKIPEDLFQL